MSIVRNYSLDVVAFSVDLGTLAKCVEYARPNPRRFAHAVLLHYMMLDISQGSLNNNRDGVIGITHEGGSYDAVMLDCFNFLKNNPNFGSRERFVSLNAMSWKDCPPLQIADLMAHENHKERQRRSTDRPRRKSLERIIENDKIGGRFTELDEELLLKY